MRKDKKKEKKSSLAVPGSLNTAGEFLANYVLPKASTWHSVGTATG